MAYLSDQDGGLNETANVTKMKTVMAEVMEDLQHTNALIVDIRKNIGGHDAVSKVVASYFVGQPSFFGAKYASNYLGDTVTVEAVVEPVDSPYLSSVAVIAGVETASAYSGAS
jgi:C-terminal processing protease CtpA/Prc